MSIKYIIMFGIIIGALVHAETKMSPLETISKDLQEFIKSENTDTNLAASIEHINFEYDYSESGLAKSTNIIAYISCPHAVAREHILSRLPSFEGVHKVTLKAIFIEHSPEQRATLLMKAVLVEVQKISSDATAQIDVLWCEHGARYRCIIRGIIKMDSVKQLITDIRRLPNIGLDVREIVFIGNENKIFFTWNSEADRGQP